jgi:hypothetical protein
VVSPVLVLRPGATGNQDQDGDDDDDEDRGWGRGQGELRGVRQRWRGKGVLQDLG